MSGTITVNFVFSVTFAVIGKLALIFAVTVQLAITLGFTGKLSATFKISCYFHCYY